MDQKELSELSDQELLNNSILKKKMFVLNSTYGNHLMLISLKYTTLQLPIVSAHAQHLPFWADV